MSARLFEQRPSWSQRLSRVRGSAALHDLRRFEPAFLEITALESDCRTLSDADLRRRAAALRDTARIEGPASVLVPVFALAREAAHRGIGQRPFDEQVVAALALASGFVVEMPTGEGKTLAAVLPAALEALSGKGVHVLTFNDYLARRDAEWMGPAYERLGLSVGFVQHGMPKAERRAAYRADVTYVTAKEAGFDHLRDLLVRDVRDRVHRAFHCAIIDEADSLMIDEARVPLVIAGRVDTDASGASGMATWVASLTPGLHYVLDEYARDVELTDAGVEHAEHTFRCGPLHDPAQLHLLTALNCALHAHVLLRRDVDYIVRDGRVAIVDEFTGRVVPDRHWPDGLQEALEAKEGLETQGGGRVLGSMTLQHFLRGYPRLCGMTGTALEAAPEFETAYGLPVVVVPSRLPVRRCDAPDVLFSCLEMKERAVIDEIARAHATGRPVLVGTASVAESENLATSLETRGIACQVLNARRDEHEARVVADAGAVGAVTISTNMAGRGTDIRLGGATEKDRDRIVALGGLYVIGTNRHESGRIDRQLRGRAGRQGDPGESRFFTSLEDDLLVRYRINDLIPRRLWPAGNAGIVTHPMVLREVERAQRIVEGQNLEIRRTLARYTTVLEQQHRLFFDRRNGILEGATVTSVWARNSCRWAALVEAVGEAAVAEAEREVTLACLDRAWRDHLATCADVREGIHLTRLGGQDPLTVFTREAIRSYEQATVRVEDEVLDILPHVVVRDGRISFDGAGIGTPAATWTYLVNDDPFEHRMASLLTAPGGSSVAIYAAVVLGPLLVAWGVADRWRGTLRRWHPRRDRRTEGG
jgi:preprotein translocase subunit SecA